MWEVARASAVPFRRAASTDDDKDGIRSPRHHGRDGTPPPIGANTPVEFPISNSLTELSTVQFPTSSPDQPYYDGSRPNSGLRTRFDSFGPDFDGATPFIRSRVQSRLGYEPPMMAEAGWRTRRESTAFVIEFFRNVIFGADDA